MMKTHWEQNNLLPLNKPIFTIFSRKEEYMITIKRALWNLIESDEYEEIDFEQINSKSINKPISTTAQIIHIHSTVITVRM